LGPIDDSDETWINGVKVGATKNQYNKPRIYDIPPGVFKAGQNMVSIRIDDTGGRGGIYGRPENMFIQTGNKQIVLAGGWKYDIEKQYDADNKPLFKDVSIGETFVNLYSQEVSTPPAAAEVAASSKGATVINMKALENEMKYDLKTFTVEAGKTIEIIFTNPDFMQHNIVITKPGAMEVVGKAADKLATDAKGASMHYVPNIPEVLFHTRLVNPQETVKLHFIAPEQVGDYPYVCTFPGHRSLMNGIMKVVKPKAVL